MHASLITQTFHYSLFHSVLQCHADLLCCNIIIFHPSVSSSWLGVEITCQNYFDLVDKAISVTGHEGL
jgi:hypothetical protein